MTLYTTSMHISEFDFDLPETLIAQYPPLKRGESRLLIDPKSKSTETDTLFSAFPQYLNAGDVLVLNNTKVIKARLWGQKKTGGKIEALIERITSEHTALAHIKASKAPKSGTELIFDGEIPAVCEGRQGDLFMIRFLCEPSVFDILDTVGHMPLPPYITRTDEGEDDYRYQTVYAEHKGAVAAPTAGLHFTESMLDALRQKGVQIATVTLHVGAGTFQPVRVEYIKDHIMHHERYHVPQETVDLINLAHQNHNKVCAIGTTSMRALESAAVTGTLQAGFGDTNIFITPGFEFQVVDMLLTNFHLPKSTLLMLVSAFAGYADIQALYQYAIAHSYKFFSYGDAMLLYKK